MLVEQNIPDLATGFSAARFTGSNQLWMVVTQQLQNRGFTTTLTARQDEEFPSGHKLPPYLGCKEPLPWARLPPNPVGIGRTLPQRKSPRQRVNGGKDALVGTEVAVSRLSVFDPFQLSEMGFWGSWRPPAEQ